MLFKLHYEQLWSMMIFFLVCLYLYLAAVSADAQYAAATATARVLISIVKLMIQSAMMNTHREHSTQKNI